MSYWQRLRLLLARPHIEKKATAYCQLDWIVVLSWWQDKQVERAARRSLLLCFCFYKLHSILLAVPMKSNSATIELANHVCTFGCYSHVLIDKDGDDNRTVLLFALV